MENELYLLAEQLGQLLISKGKKIVTAESCTGGWIAKTMTDVPGSSTWFERGFVTYSNCAKMQMLDVKPETLENFGAVSAQTVREMISGALRNSDADYALAVSGIAGPDGGTEQKPVGTVFLAWNSSKSGIKTVCQLFSGNRFSIRQQTVKLALTSIYHAITTEESIAE